jgi:hypothetical protein
VDEGVVGWVHGWGHGRERKIKEKRREIDMWALQQVVGIEIDI